MKKFILHITLFLLLVAIAFLWVISRAGLELDEFYGRFISPKQQALILGTSRAAQGLNPDVMNVILERKDLFNYSFTNEHSPYGPVYLESIKRKVDENTKDGIFILTVDPWNLGSDIHHPNDEALFRENDLMLSGMFDVSSSPNFLYLLKYYEGSYDRILRRVQDPQLHLHANGWLEVIVPTDSVSVAKRTRERIKLYREETLKRYAFSSARLSWLGKTIDFLRKHGEVYLVRLPVSDEMIEIEEEQNASFNDIVASFSHEMNVRYLDMSTENDDILFTDGNHIAKQSTSTVSKRVAQFILEYP